MMIGLARVVLLSAFAFPVFAADADAPPEEKAALRPDEPWLAERYFAIGAWRIGMTRDQALAHFAEVVPEPGGKVLKGIATPYFGGPLPATLTFVDDRLASVKLLVYDGTDRAASRDRLREILVYMDEHFGGGSLEGLTVDEDPKRVLHEVVIEGTIEKMSAALVEVNRKRKKRDPRSAYTLVFEIMTPLVAPDNFLYGQYRYESDTQRTTVELWDDRAFVKARSPKAMVMMRPDTRD